MVFSTFIIHGLLKKKKVVERREEALTSKALNETFSPKNPQKGESNEIHIGCVVSIFLMLLKVLEYSK